MTIVEQLEEKVKALADAEAKVKADAEAIAAMKTNTEELAKEIVELKSKAVDSDAAHVKAMEEAVKVLEAEKAEHQKAKDELGLVRKALDNPAYAAAAAKGSQQAVEEGEGEAKAEKTFEQAHAEYKAIEDPRARAEYREQHAKELRLK